MSLRIPGLELPHSFQAGAIRQDKDAHRRDDRVQVKTVCTSCGKKYLVNPQLLGRVVECKNCHTKFHVARVPEQTGSPDGDPPPGVVAPHELDPLALPIDVEMAGESMPPAATPAAAQPVAMPLASGGGAWQQKVKQHSRAALFGPTQRALFYLGLFLIAIGLLLNILPLMGTQVARFQGAGNLGQIFGLVMGMIGAGLLAAALHRFHQASIAGGLGSAGFVFIVFLFSILSPSDPNSSANSNGDVNRLRPEEVTKAVSPWIQQFPNWEGFDDPTPGLSVADRWTNYTLNFNDGKYIASFPRKPVTSQQQVNLARQQVPQAIYKRQAHDHEFEISIFDHPNQQMDREQIANEVARQFWPGATTISLDVKGVVGKELTTKHDTKRTHGRILVKGHRVIQLSVTGPASRVPGPTSRRFLRSFQLNPPAAAATGPLGGGTSIQLNITPSERNAATQMLTRARQIENLMDEFISMRARLKFPGHYLSEPAGGYDGTRKFFCRPEKLPVTGIDMVFSDSSKGQVLHRIVPVYEGSENPGIVHARPGYGLGAINVNADAFVKGVQFVFMKISPKGFDTSDAYTSDWYGVPASSGEGTRVGGDGRPVYGLWCCQSTVVHGLGVIHERQ